MLTDIEIARNTKLKPITNIAHDIGIKDEDMEFYGNYKAKISLNAIDDREYNNKLILVTAMSPTPAGEGKTTTSIGLADALNLIGKKADLALREPSLGPVFGVKGGATGGGYSQVAPMEDINLHFTGDFHAIGAANNLLVAMVDNHIFQGNELNIDPATITVKHCVDMNDRQLRNIQSGLGGDKNGRPREDGFDITVASEIMAILCLSNSMTELKERLGNVIVAYNTYGMPVTARELKANGAMAVLLKDAIKPNLVQTLAGTPAFIHGGPFANIAHGCNSILATRMARTYADYTVTEAGFGSDLGAEKFLDIKCRENGIKPDCVVLVATIRSMKMHGGVAKDKLEEENTEAIIKGFENVKRHYNNITREFGLPCVVALNCRNTDTESEKETFEMLAVENNMAYEFANPYGMGGLECTLLASKVVKMCEMTSDIHYAYDKNKTLREKLSELCGRIYGAMDVSISETARQKINMYGGLLDGLPICIAKTQYSFSDNPSLLGAPTDFVMEVRDIKLCAGAGFIVVYMGNILTMPGLPKHPAAENIDIDENGNIVGIF